MKLPEDRQDECNQTSLYEISRNRLRVIEKLGEGNFGMVSTFLCYFLMVFRQKRSPLGFIRHIVTI